ncbi:unnamed protein product [Calypogeia fissa]
MSLLTSWVKAQIAANQRFPLLGTVLFSINDLTKAGAVPICQHWNSKELRLKLLPLPEPLREKAGVEVESVLKLHEGRPHTGNLMATGGIHMMRVAGRK